MNNIFIRNSRNSSLRNNSTLKNSKNYCFKHGHQRAGDSNQTPSHPSSFIPILYLPFDPSFYSSHHLFPKEGKNKGRKMLQDRPLKEDLRGKKTEEGEIKKGNDEKSQTQFSVCYNHLKSFSDWFCLASHSWEVENVVCIPWLLLCGSVLGSEKGTGSNWENNSETSDDRTITAVLNTLNNLVNGDTEEVCILNIVTYVYKPLERTLLTCLSAFMRVQMAKHFLCVGEFIKFIGLTHHFFKDQMSTELETNFHG